MLTGNKGEWSEIYTFFILLADKKVFSGDADLNKIEELFYPIIRILREEQAAKFEYHIDKNVVLVFGGDKEIKIPVETFKEIAEQLFERIRNAKGVFSLPEVEEFMSSIYCLTLKAKSTDKTDIKVVIHDLRTGLQHLLGFSIKSKLGSPSTLLNAGVDTTNFIYQIKGIDKAIAKEINQVKKFQDKFELLRKYKARIKFVSPANSVFKSNLIYVDYCLPDIIGNIALLYYSTPNSKISDIVNIINDENPLDFDYTYNQDFYEHKVKRFLTDIALGLKTAKPWKGKYEATGGYLIVKEDGDVICYQNISSVALLDSANFVLNQIKISNPSNIIDTNIKHKIELQQLYKQIAYQKSILNKNSRNAIAWVELARLYSIQGFDAKAERSMKNALFLAPENRYVLRSMSRFFSHVGNIEFADDFIKKANITKYDPWVMATSVALSDMRGKYSKFAKSGLQKIDSKKLNPFSTAELSTALATLELKNGKIKNSKKLFKDSLTDPNDNSLAQAEWASQKELKLDTVNPQQFNLKNSFEALARDFKEKGEWEESIKYSKDWFLDMPYSKGAIIFGYDVALHKLKDLSQASEIGKLGLLAHPNDPFLINNIMYALSLENNTIEAENLYNRIKNSKLDRLSSTNICLTATRGLLNYRKGNVEDGRRLYLEAMELAKELGNDDLTNKALVNFAREEIIATKDFDNEFLEKLKQLKKKTRDEQVIELIAEVLDLREHDT